MKIQRVPFKEWSRKKKVFTVTAELLAVALAGGGVGYYFLTAKDTVSAETTEQEVTLQYGTISLDLSETGTTAVGTDSQLPDFDVSQTDMVVEEVYVEAGSSVTAGDALYKLTDDCVAELTAYYEEKVADAKDDLETAQLNYSTGKLEAQYDKQSTDTTAEYAAAEYQAGLDALALAVTNAETALNNAQTQITTYQGYLDNNTYYTDNGISDKTTALSDAQNAETTAKTAYDTAKKAYQTAQQDFETALNDEEATLNDEETTVTVEDLRTLYTALTAAKQSYETAEAAYDKAKDARSKAEQELSNAQTKYETQVENAKEKVESLTSSLSSLQSAYDSAVRDQTTQAVELKETYDEAVLNGNYSGTAYESTVAELEAAVETAEETLESAEEEQEALLALENGVIVAAQDGTIASMTYEAEDILFPDMAVVSYYNTETINVSVEVPQTDIAKINVGDTVDVQISGYRGGELTGNVSTIGTSATSGGSLSNVNYTVTVSVDNSEGQLGAGSTAAVTFNFGEIEDVYYLPADAVSNISGTTGEIKQYDAEGNLVSAAVEIGDVTEDYVVITDGLEEDAVCIISAE